ncbi:MAG: family N-acetyltransferase [Acidimicrobiales bacterium]|jgi:GNAT superfamily N-acetyltransferase|nr:family N-acetyltransferase [Acidimicrobiales bacterium]
MLCGMRIRSVQRSEVARLREIRLRALLDAPSAFGSTYDEESERALEAWLSWVEPGVTVIVEDDAGWHGLAAARLDADEQALVHVFSMWVESELRGQRLGERLLGALLEWAWQSGATKVRLGVVDGNDAAMTLYRRMGFSPTGNRERLRSYPSQECVFMEVSRGADLDHP